MGMCCWENPGRYLGLPTEWGRNKTSTLDWIKERVMSKLQGWKEGLLNQAGKEVLIKAVIQAIPTYAKTMIKFPKTFCQSPTLWWPNSGGLLMGRTGEYTGRSGVISRGARRRECSYLG